MRKVALMMLIFVAMLGSKHTAFAIDCNKLPARPFPATAINDLAGMLDEGTRLQLEKELDDYWNQTSLALVVVTVDTMNGDNQVDYSTSLFNCWGIGDKTNRGVLIFISKKDKKVSLRTGSGIEYLVTDAQSGHVRDVIISYFNKREFSKGIDAGVKETIEIFGHMSWADREAGRKEQEAVKKRENEADMQLLIDVLWVLLALGCSGGLFYLAYRRSKREARTKYLREFQQSLRKQIAQNFSDITELRRISEGMPMWAQSVIGRECDEVFKKLNECHASVDTSEKMMKDKLSLAGTTLDKAETLRRQAMDGLQKLVVTTQTKIVEHADSAPKLLEQAQEAIESAYQTILANKQFGFDDYHSQLDELLAEVNQLTKSLSDNNLFKDICERVPQIIENVKSIDGPMRKTVQVQSSISQGIALLKEQLIGLNKQVPAQIVLLNDLKGKYANEVWTSLEESLNENIACIDPKTFEPLLKEIELDNSFDVRNFGQAENQYNNIVAIIESTEKDFALLAQIPIDQENARSQYQTAYNSLSHTVSLLMEKVKDSDVDNHTRKQASEVHSTLESFIDMSRIVRGNWIVTLRMVQECESIAKKVYSKAQGQIDDADKKRKNDEAERQRSLIAAAAIISSNNNRSSNDDDDNRGGGGFGGLGGGNTNGGGADGGWN